MGRSVMTLGHDSIVAYTSFDPQHFCDECDDFCEEHQDELFCDAGCDHSDEYQDLLDWIQSTVIEMFPSMSEADSWYDREVHIIAENAHSMVGVSEYCGLVSVSLGERTEYGYYYDSSALGAHWRAQVADKFLKAFGEYQKLGTFSNGESVFQKIA